MSQAQTAEPEEAAEAEHHVEKAARKEEVPHRETPRGQALLQGAKDVALSVQPTPASMRDAFMQSLSFK